MGDFDRRGKHDEITISTEVRLPGCKIFFLFSSTTIKDQLVLTILTSPLSYPAARTLPSPFWSLPTATAHASLRWESEEGCMQAVGLSGHLRSHTLTLPSLEAVATSGGPTPSPSPAMPSTAFTRSSCARRLLTGWKREDGQLLPHIESHCSPCVSHMYLAKLHIKNWMENISSES